MSVFSITCTFFTFFPPDVLPSKLSPQEQHEPLKLQDVIDDIKNNIDNYDLILRRCIDIGKIEDQGE